MKGKQPQPGFELRPTIPFPRAITVMLSVSESIWVTLLNYVTYDGDIH